MTETPVESTLRALVGTDSVYPGEDRLAEDLRTRLVDLGFEVSKPTYTDSTGKTRPNVMGERGPPGDSILFYGHIDTVPPSELYHGTHLELREDPQNPDHLRGLGCADMKGGIAATLVALGEVSREKRVKVLFCSDEEEISQGAFAATGDPANKAWFEDVRLVISGEIGVSGEPSLGVRGITLGRRGRCVVRVNVQGRAAHGSVLGKDRLDAIDEAGRIIVGLERFPRSKNPSLPRGFPPESVFVRRMEAASKGLSFAEQAVLDVDMHYVLDGGPDAAKARVEDFLKGLCGKGRGRVDPRSLGEVRLKNREDPTGKKERATPFLQPYATRRDDERIRRVVSIMTKMFQRPRVRYGSSVADENVLFYEIPRVQGKEPGSVTVAVIGPEGGEPHAFGEWISRKSLEELVLLYRALAERALP